MAPVLGLTPPVLAAVAGGRVGARGRRLLRRRAGLDLHDPVDPGLGDAGSHGWYPRRPRAPGASSCSADATPAGFPCPRAGLRRAQQPCAVPPDVPGRRPGPPAGPPRPCAGSRTRLPRSCPRPAVLAPIGAPPPPRGRPDIDWPGAPATAVPLRVLLPGGHHSVDRPVVAPNGGRGPGPVTSASPHGVIARRGRDRRPRDWLLPARAGFARSGPSRAVPRSAPATTGGRKTVAIFVRSRKRAATSTTFPSQWEGKEGYPMLQSRRNRPDRLRVTWASSRSTCSRSSWSSPGVRGALRPS